MLHALTATNTFADEASALAAAQSLGRLVVVAQQVEIVEEAPPPPFTTADLLEEAILRLGWNAAQVMQVAQRLFEGIVLDSAHTGLITYHRTDSIRVVPEAAAQVRAVIADMFGPQALPAQATVPSSPWWKGFPWLSRPAAPEEHAHEAIRPTNPGRTPEQLAPHLDEQSLALYRLIWERFLASQMRPAKYRQVIVELEAA